MKKVQSFLAAIALVAALSGLSWQGRGLAAMANAEASQHASASIMAGQLASSGGPKRYGPCPGGGGWDC